MGKYPNHLHEQGAALIMALFIVALVAAMSYAMMIRLDRDIVRTQMLLRNTQGKFYARGSLAWAKDQLRNDWERQKSTRLIDDTPISSPENTVNNYKIKSIIYDMQARFNLNNLSDPNFYDDFKRLLQLTAPFVPPEKAQALIKNIVEWISPLTNKDNSFYLENNPPFRAAHRLLSTVSELRFIKGMTPALFNALLPYVTVLPEVTSVNVQTASPQLLVSIIPTLTLSQGRAIAEIRKHTPFLSMGNFKNVELLKNQSIPEKKLDITSKYFLVQTMVSIENQQIVLYTLLERTVNEENVKVVQLWQSQGVW